MDGKMIVYSTNATKIKYRFLHYTIILKNPDVLTIYLEETIKKLKIQ